MVLQFNLYEELNHDVELDKPHQIIECLTFDENKGMLLMNWFYRKDVHVRNLKEVYGENRHFVEIYGEDIWDIILALAKVLNELVGWKRDLLAYHYFPVIYSIPSYNKGVDMWSDEYYTDLKEIYNQLYELVDSDNVYNRERRFFYNISW